MIDGLDCENEVFSEDHPCAGLRTAKGLTKVTGMICAQLPLVLACGDECKWVSLCLWRSCQLRLPSEQTGHGQEDLINKPLSIICKSFILSRAASVESSSIMNPQSPPRGYGFCFLISTQALYWITIVYIRYSFLGLHLCVDDTESASQVQGVSLFLWGMGRGISTELARGWKAIAKDSIWFEVSLFLWILPYPVPTESSVWFSVQHYVGWGACDLDMPRYVLLSPCQ